MVLASPDFPGTWKLSRAWTSLPPPQSLAWVEGSVGAGGRAGDVTPLACLSPPSWGTTKG